MEANPNFEVKKVTSTVLRAAITFADSSTHSANQTFTFSRYYGDYNGDGVVNGVDFNIFAPWFNHALPNSLWYIDPTGNGIDNGIAFAELSAHFNHGDPCNNSGNILTGPFPDVVTGSNGIILGLNSAVTAPVQTFYYSNQWQVVQENFQASSTATPELKTQNVWGEAYVNELILRDSNADNSLATSVYGKPGSGLEQRIYALQDANWNVTTLLGPTGNELQQYVYDPYGNVKIASQQDFPFNDPYGFAYLFQGGRIDSLTGLYTFQHRDYNPVTATWMEEDPAGYLDGPNMYQFAHSDPTSTIDPNGEEGVSPMPPVTRPMRCSDSPIMDYITVGEVGVGAFGLGHLGINHMLLLFWTGGHPIPASDNDTRYMSMSDFAAASGATVKDTVQLEPFKFQSSAYKTLYDYKVSDILEGLSGAQWVVWIYGGAPDLAEPMWRNVITSAGSYPYAEHYTPPMPGPMLWTHWPNSDYQSNGNNSNTFIRWVAAKSNLNLQEEYLPGFRPGNDSPEPVTDAPTLYMPLYPVK